MGWYAAHAILLVRFIDGIQNKYPFYENVLLIQANSEQQALEKAAMFAREQESGEDDGFTWQSHPAALEFAGIRKLMSCEDPEEKPRNGTEITYLQMEVSSNSSFLKLLNSEEVEVNYFG